MFITRNALDIELLKTLETRRHSSRMRTARLLPVSPSMHCAGWLVSVQGVSARGVSAHGECLPKGLSAEWVSAKGVCISTCNEGDTPPEQNDRQV